MSEVKKALELTNEQRLAIEKSGGNILVTASAGSGKTMVLTERILRKITEEDADIREFVVVTFMKAAAAEMKERLNKKLNEYLLSHPENRRIKYQQMYLRDANIATIDSFCLSLIERYQSVKNVGYSPEIRIATETEKSILLNKAFSEVIESEYEKGEPEFYALSDALDGAGSNDNGIKSAVFKLRDIMRTNPNRAALKGKFVGMFGSEYGDIRNNRFFSSAFDNLEVAVDVFISIADGLISSAYDPESAASRKFISFISGIRETLSNLKEAAREFESARCRELLSSKLAASPKKPNENEWYESCQAFKTKVAAYFKTAAEDFGVGADFLSAEAELLKPMVAKLFELAEAVDEEYAKLKEDKSLWDYDDIELKAVSLLWEEDEAGELRRTEISIEEGKKYKEILIDEYQDVNEVQELIFRGICSENEDNIFMVGDVKQSIYAFRGATPKLFLRHRDEYTLATPEDIEYPAKIALNDNFRSRAEVIEAVNAVFAAIMKKNTCGMDYLEEDALKYASDYGESEHSGAFLTLVEGKYENECEYIAYRIRELMASGMTVKEKDGLRPLRYGDIAVLLRRGKDKAALLVDALREAGIPAVGPASDNPLKSPSVRKMVAVLRAIDNPMKDINLVAAMTGGVFGFTESELVRVRKCGKEAFYYAVKAAAEGGNEKCAEFISRLEHLRRKAATLTADKLIWYIYKTGGFLSFATTLKNGKREHANLLALYEEAVSYGSFGRQDLSGFVSYLDKVIAEDGTIGESVSVPSQDEVKVITVHKSKGLEYPVCFLCNIGASFSSNSVKGAFLADADFGIGMKIIKAAEHKRTTTAARESLKRLILEKEKREEMRVLYVALTRAKEYLEIVGSVANPAKKAEEAMYKLDSAGRLDDFTVNGAKSVLDWVLPVAMGSDKLQKRIAPAYSVCECEAAETTVAAEIDEELAERIYNNISYKYEYASSAALPTKMTVSDIVAMQAGKESGDSCCERKPACLDRSRRSGAEAGTATHALLQFADFPKLEDAEAEIARLVAQRFITEARAELIDRKKLAKFVSSDIFKRIRSAEKVTREFRFTFEAAASDFLPDVPKDAAAERLIVQGAIDCMFEENGRCIVVDYKTDRIKNDETLGEKVAYYSAQLKIYARAVKEITGREVDEGILYFLDADREVKVL